MGGRASGWVYAQGVILGCGYVLGQARASGLLALNSSINRLLSRAVDKLFSASRMGVSAPGLPSMSSMLFICSPLPLFLRHRLVSAHWPPVAYLRCARSGIAVNRA